MRQTQQTVNLPPLVMRGSIPWLSTNFAGLAQTVERLPCKQDIAGSNPLTQTNNEKAPFDEGL